MLRDGFVLFLEGAKMKRQEKKREFIFGFMHGVRGGGGGRRAEEIGSGGGEVLGPQLRTDVWTKDRRKDGERTLNSMFKISVETTIFAVFFENLPCSFWQHWATGHWRFVCTTK